MSKKSISRVEAEKAEGLDQIKNDLPENRVQTTQQIADTESALDTKPAENDFSKKTVKGKGSSLKQEKISDVLTGSSSANGMGISFAGRSVSGTANGVLGANNSTPMAGQSRSTTRVGKKLDRLATKLNYTPSENAVIEFDESKPLADAVDKDQGFNGTYRNTSARSQKIMGAVPADMMFQRSCDLILKDQIYFLQGQQVFQTGTDQAENDLHYTFDKDIKDWTGYSNPTGNYYHKAQHIGLLPNGKVYFNYFDVEDVTPEKVAPDLANTVSAHRLINSNVAELDRIVMDAKAGDEKADIWSPLPRAVKEPTRTVYSLAAIEAETGGYVHLAYSKATTNMSYQLNRALKDGLKDKTPGIEECIGWRYDKAISDDVLTDAASLQDLFTTAHYQAGDPQLMIAAYDSPNKYNSKADLLLQPRGFRMHLQTADNNMDALKVPKEYATIYAGQETFSTIEHEYDPLLPVCMSDKANLILAHDLNRSTAFISSDFDMNVTATNIETSYKYDTYTLIPANFEAKCGYTNLYLYQKVSAGDGLIYSTGVVAFEQDSSDGARNVKLHISNHELSESELGTGGAFEGYELLTTIAAAGNTTDIVLHAPVVQNANNTVITAASINVYGYIFAKDGGIFNYAYSDLRNNYIVEVKHPLVFGIINYLEESIGSKFAKLLGGKELYIPYIFSTQYMTLAQLIICAATPWIQKVRYNSMKDVIYYEDNIHEYPFSKLDSLKNVPFKNYVNFSYSGYDEPLGTKVMQPTVMFRWIMPEFFWKVSSDSYTYVLPWYFNQTEMSTTGSIPDANDISFPSIRSGVRLSVLDNFYSMDEKDVRLSLDRMSKAILDSEKITSRRVYKYGLQCDGQPCFTLSSNLTISEILKQPRELGLMIDAPYGVLTPDPTNGFSQFSANGMLTSFRIKFWTNNNTLATPSILASTGVNIGRGTDYSQKWFQIFADGATSATMISGLVFGLNDEVSNAVYNPFVTANDAIDVTAPAVVSFQRSIWTRLQLIPFIISPFDAVSSLTNIRDIYDFAYFFGLAGFRASDYRESVYNREKEVVNQGMLFIEDPWILASPIFKQGASSTGISTTKGFELDKK